jgi:hypothetical protein
MVYIDDMMLNEVKIDDYTTVLCVCRLEYEIAGPCFDLHMEKSQHLSVHITLHPFSFYYTPTCLLIYSSTIYSKPLQRINLIVSTASDFLDPNNVARNPTEGAKKADACITGQELCR